MLKRFDHVSVERVCSGIGIPSIYEYLRDVEQIPERPEIAHAIASATDHTAAITNFAFDEHNPCELCKATVDTFVSVLASEAANMALKVMATGGVYLGGGIPPHMAHPTQKLRFMETFKQKGRFSQLMDHIPVHVILNRAALLGSAAYGLESFKEES